MKNQVFLLLFFLSFTCQSVLSEDFEFMYREGDQYRAVSEVQEETFVFTPEDSFSFESLILNKISFSITAVEDGVATVEGEFIVSEQKEGTGDVYAVTSNYDSKYKIDKKGNITIGAEYMMPVVRNVPVFPDRALKPGDTWHAEGHEVHDFRESTLPLSVAKFPITAAYTYEGKTTFEGETYDLIHVEYTVYHRLPNDRGAGYTMVSGYSVQDLYWNAEKGRHYRAEDEFEFKWDFPGGITYLFRGRAVSRIIEAELMDKEKIAGEIRESIDKDALDDTSVAVDDRGVTIAIENIRFAADSAVFLPGEIDKIAKISSILKRYPGRDILISGHTALAGTPEGRKQLSLERARAVADQIISLGARTQTEIMIRGYGATRPAASNATEAGRRQNRRVEITILEN